MMVSVHIVVFWALLLCSHRSECLCSGEAAYSSKMFGVDFECRRPQSGCTNLECSKLRSFYIFTENNTVRGNLNKGVTYFM